MTLSGEGCSNYDGGRGDGFLPKMTSFSTTIFGLIFDSFIT